ncbi:chymotrypsin-1-like isoform X2 [Temnothorax curvispinosus]|uniref:Chymotrypsin-1-like isoform X2 n=1 Tax=Temnothorax curvispinosus TaxID=300111 RepID=A0A6J1QRA6_9HYME|nr:chymotrypsin-1-like isoform X2 [Temnothorax curvispinosus]
MKQLACILIALAIVGAYGDEPDKLVNGIPANIEDYPHCVSIRVDNTHFCGGSIIDKQHILTAGHCVAPLIQDSRLRKSVTVVTGTTYLNEGGQSHKVEKLWYHDDYNPRASRGNYDIGLIKLTSPIQFGPKVRQIGLPRRNIAENDGVTIAAWGAMGLGKPIHKNLQKLYANAMLPQECQQYHGNSMLIHNNEFCTLISYGTGLCTGDSGSGLLRNSDRTIVGLVSGVRPCAIGYPDVYTNVYTFVPWIQQKMRL